MSMDAKVSRRDAMAKLGAGIAGVAVGGAAGAKAQTANGEKANTSAPFVDPTTKYPKPPAAVAGVG